MRRFLLLLLLISNALFAQKEKYSRKSIKLYHKAEIAFEQRQNIQAENLLLQVIEKEEGFVEAYIALGDLYLLRYDYTKAAEKYILAKRYRPKGFKYLDLKIAKVLHKCYRFDEALVYLKAYLEQVLISESNRKAAYSLKREIEFALELEYEEGDTLQRLSDSVNTIYDEYLPSITVDGGTLIFTRAYPNYGRRVEDFFFSEKAETGKFSEARFLEGPFNTSENEGAQCTSADGNFLIYTACNRTDGFGSCDLYYSYKVNGKWKQPVNLGENVNSPYWDTQPSISPDGKILYFVSNRPGGYGGMDIWKSTLTSTGEWTRPVNMGRNINTSKDEMSPFIHWDNQTLYFASRGWQGMGGFDLFKSSSEDKKIWKETINLGFPINSPFDDNSLIVEQDGITAYFVSEQVLDNKINLDIFTYQLKEELKALPVAYLKGFVKNELGKVENAKVSIFDLSSDTLFYQGLTNEMEGSFFACLGLGKEYAIHIEKDGHFFYSEHIELPNTLSINSKVERDFLLKKTEVGEAIVLHNIFFDFDSWGLSEKSIQEVQKIYHFLSRNEAIIVEIGGHTDNVGLESYNQSLSKKRAQSVKGALIDLGVNQDRIRIRGYGDAKPIKPNDSPENRDINRRTELKIVE